VNELLTIPGLASSALVKSYYPLPFGTKTAERLFTYLDTTLIT